MSGFRYKLMRTDEPGVVVYQTAWCDRAGNERLISSQLFHDMGWLDETRLLFWNEQRSISEPNGPEGFYIRERFGGIEVRDA